MLTYVVPDEVAHFYENKTFAQASSKESDALWQSLIPGRDGKYVVNHLDAFRFSNKPNKGANGMMVIRNPEQYGIEEGLMIGPNTYKYGVSMFHSLHCLVCTSLSSNCAWESRA